MFVWGKFPRGLNMSLYGRVNEVPQLFKEVNRYNFSKLYLNENFGIGISHSVKFVLETPNEAG